ncbi:MAG: MJ0042-type zinc finger domain-containing protein, partial [Steroidobacteraceae bacterium]
MLTQCPECQTTFRITPAILRAASGQVRCGRCRT